MATAIGIALSVVLSACSSSGGTTDSATENSKSNAAHGTHPFTDQAGRVVQIPNKVTRVATIGFITGLDSYMYMAGASDLLVSGIPSPPGSQDFLRPYKQLAPRLLRLPTVQSAVMSDTFDKEGLLKLHPNLVLTGTVSIAKQVQALGIPAVVISDQNTGQALMHDVADVGKAVGRPGRAAAYTKYYKKIINQVQRGVASVPAADRPSALYLDFNPSPNQPTPVEAWAFRVLGVHNVVPSGVSFHYQFSKEQLYTWDPDYIITQLTDDTTKVKSPAFAALSAVRAGHVAQMPSGFNIWGDNTVEEPLGLLWTAKYLFPKQFADVDLAAATASFYATFFHVKLSAAQVSKILHAGGLS